MGGSLASISMTALSTPRPDERAQDVLDRVHLDAAFGDGGGALDGFDVLDPGVNGRLVRQVDAFEFEAAAGGGGPQGEGDFLAGVQGGAREAGGAGEGLLGDGSGHRGAEGEWRGIEERRGLCKQR